MKKSFTALFIGFSILFSIVAQAGEISVSWGESTSRWYFRDRGELTADGYRIAYIHPTNYKWEFANNSSIRLELEAGIHEWRDPFLHIRKRGVVVNPMWRYYFPVFSQKLFAGAGIGLTYTNDDRLMDRKLGSRLLFEDKFEIGILIENKHRLSMSVNHYSNANIADINHGVNFFFVNYAYSL